MSVNTTECETFGQYLSEKRKEKGLSLRRLAAKLGVSAPYLSDGEKDRKTAFDADRIEALAVILLLSKEEKNVLMDLAGQQRKSFIPPDLARYINEHKYVRTALRTARDLGAHEEDWRRFAESLLGG